MRNKINVIKNIYYKTSLIILSISFLILSSCRVNKTNTDVAHVNSKSTISNNNLNATKEGINNVNNLSDTLKPKKVKKCFLSNFLKNFVNPYDDRNLDPENDYDNDNEYQIEYDDIRDQRD